MKRLSKWLPLLTILLVVLICLPAVGHAQEDCFGGIDPACDPGDPNPPPECLCPIDGGLSTLLIIGVGYGIKKIRDARNS